MAYEEYSWVKREGRRGRSCTKNLKLKITGLRDGRRKKGRVWQKETEEISPGKCSSWAPQMGAEVAMGNSKAQRFYFCPLPPGDQRHWPQDLRRLL